jgi:hypothetical protein
MMHEVINMAGRTRKTSRPSTDKERELEMLLRGAFRKLNTRKRHSEIKIVGGQRPEKVQ